MKRSTAPQQTPKQPDREGQAPERGGDVRHVVDTGLPPGITPQDLIDPGSQPPEDRIQRRRP